MTITNAASLRQALRALHHIYHVPHVVISSIPLTQWLHDLFPDGLRPPSGTDTPYLACIASSRKADGSSTVHTKCFTCLPGYFSGVGDLFSALVLAHFHPPSASPPVLAQNGPAADADSTPLSRAASEALTKTHALLAFTHAAAAALPAGERTETDEERDAGRGCCATSRGSFPSSRGRAARGAAGPG